MQRSVSFLRLPRELISLLVTDWLEWEAVARCDSALCNYAHRAEWRSILKNDSVAPVVSCSFSSPPMHGWFLMRHVRTFDLRLDNTDPYNHAATISWLTNTSSLLSRMTIRSVPDESILSCIVQHCVRLKVLMLYCCIIKDSHWKHFCALSRLEELRVCGSRLSARMSVPTNLSFPMLYKLNICWDWFNDASEFIQQLPSLRSLRLEAQYLSDICGCFDGACPNLVHLDLQQCGPSGYFSSDADQFVQLMKSLKKGLGCLILPTMQIFTATELESIVQYHAHSLRCIGLSDRNLRGNQDAVGVLFNSLPRLHTIVTSYRALAAWTSPVLNSTIQHLCNMDRTVLSMLENTLMRHFPALTTISISCTYFYAASEVVQVLALRPSIRTLNVTKYGYVAEELKKMMPTVTAGVYDGFDMFCTDF